MNRSLCLVSIRNLLLIASVAVFPVAEFFAATTAQAGHPLDPLSADEINTALQVIEGYSKFPSGAFFPIVKLNEPAKNDILAWSPGKPFKREAFANVFDRTKNQLFEAVVDLNAQKVSSWKARPNMQPAVFLSEYTDGDALARTSKQWQKITFCNPQCNGFNQCSHKGLRLDRV